MAYSSVAPKTVTVNLSDEQQMHIVKDRVELLDARAYSTKVVAVMNLDDAVLFAQTVMAFIDAVYPVICPVCHSDVCDCIQPDYVPNVHRNFVPPIGPNDLPY